jgi:Domain of unknown function (DUF4190)
MEDSITPEAGPPRRCPGCGRPLAPWARRCRACAERARREAEGDDLDYGRTPDISQDPAVRWLIPVGRSGWALAAGYLGLLSCFPFIGLPLGLAALTTGILAVRSIRRNPKLTGMGRAVTGIVLGLLGTLFWGITCVALILNVGKLK